MKTLPIRGETHNDYDIGGSGDTYISGKSYNKNGTFRQIYFSFK